MINIRSFQMSKRFFLSVAIIGLTSALTSTTASSAQELQNSDQHQGLSYYYQVPVPANIDPALAQWRMNYVNFYFTDNKLNLEMQLPDDLLGENSPTILLKEQANSSTESSETGGVGGTGGTSGEPPDRGDSHFLTSPIGSATCKGSILLGFSCQMVGNKDVKLDKEAILSFVEKKYKDDPFKIQRLQVTNSFINEPIGILQVLVKN